MVADSRLSFRRFVAAGLVLICAAAPQVCRAGPDPSLVLHYAFDSDPGAVAEDLSGYGHDGTIVDGEYHATVNGRPGVVRLSGGTNAAINCPDADALFWDGDLSFEMWVRRSGDANHLWATLFGDGQNWAFYVRAWHQLVFWHSTYTKVFTPTGYTSESTLHPVDMAMLGDDWSHIAVVVEAPRMKFYRDGALVRDAYMPIGGLIHRSRAATAIGWRNPIDLDEIRVYRRALPAAEVAQHALGNYPAPYAEDEIFVETHWYEETVAVRLSCTGTDYSGHTATMTLKENGLDAVTPQLVPMTEPFADVGRYTATATFPLAGLEGRTLDGEAVIKTGGGAPVKTVGTNGVSMAKPAWVDTTEGYTNAVLPPWTPLTAAEDGGTITISVWGRQYVVGSTPLFREIHTAGNQVLAQPMRLAAETVGGALTWNAASATLTGSSNLRAEYGQTFTSTDGKVLVNVGGVTEYDGYTIFDLSVQAVQAMTLQRLVLEIPQTATCATLCTAFGVYPDDAEAPINQDHRGSVTGDLQFRFSGNIWLGNEELGLLWQAESDEAWRYADEQEAIEILPGGGATTFRANLVNVARPLAAGETLDYRFALMATPIKPIVRDQWDLRVARSEPFGKDLDLPGLTTEGIPTLQYYTSVGVRNLFIDVNDTWPWPMPIDNQVYADKLVDLVDACHGYGLQAHNYYIHGRMPTHVPEFDIHGFHMARRPVNQYTVSSEPPGTPRPGAITHDYGANSQGTVTFCPKSTATRDAHVAALARSADAFGEDGVYLDGTGQLMWCKNLAHGCGYEADGYIHRTYPVFAAREFAKRIYTVEKTRNPDAVVDNHCSFGYNPAALAYADVYWLGEQWWHLRHVGTDYVHGELPLDMFRAEFMGYAIGVPAETLHYRLCAYHPHNWKKVLATSLLHDVPIRVSAYPQTGEEGFETLQKIWAMRDAFGAEDAGMQRRFYCNNQDSVTVSPAECYATLLTHPTNGVLALISNLRANSATVTVQFDLDALGLGGQTLEAFDPLVEQRVSVTPGGEISVFLGSEAWLYVWLRPAQEKGGPVVLVDENFDNDPAPPGGTPVNVCCPGTWLPNRFTTNMIPDWDSDATLQLETYDWDSDRGALFSYVNRPPHPGGLEQLALDGFLQFDPPVPAGGVITATWQTKHWEGEDMFGFASGIQAMADETAVTWDAIEPKPTEAVAQLILYGGGYSGRWCHFSDRAGRRVPLVPEPAWDGNTYRFPDGTAYTDLMTFTMIYTVGTTRVRMKINDMEMTVPAGYESWGHTEGDPPEIRNITAPTQVDGMYFSGRRANTQYYIDDILVTAELPDSPAVFLVTLAALARKGPRSCLPPRARETTI